MVGGHGRTCVRKRLIALLGVELIVAAFIVATVCIRRHDEVRAYAAWHERPTAETRAALDRERRITAWHQAGLALVMFGVMAGPTLIFARRCNKGRKPVDRE